MNKTIIFLSALASFAAVACSKEQTKMPWENDLDNKKPSQENVTPEAKVGEPLPPWTDGCLDIHFINSGRGECAFYILPDGTGVPQKPDASTRPYIVDAKYIRHFLPQGSSAIDWCAPSHFHIDHIGSRDAAAETSPNGYRLTGLMALYGEIPFSRVLDRGYPNYGDDQTIPGMDGQTIEDWKKLVKYAVAERGMKADRFKAGEEQITLLKDKSKYPDFRIFNIVANCYAWNLDSQTGSGTLVDKRGGTMQGNRASCGFHLTYGKFDYITCGDLTGPPQNLMAYYYRDFVSKDGLDVFKAHHHLSANSWGSQMQNNEFSPRVIISQNFYKKQPDIPLLTNIVNGSFGTHPYTWTKDIFIANVPTELLAENAELYKKVAGYNGHIVVRVAPGGAEYYVYMLNDTDFDYKVKSIHGPYSSK